MNSSLDEHQFDYVNCIAQEDASGRLVLKAIAAEGHGKLKTRQIQDRTGLSKAVVQNRLNKLEREKVLAHESIPHPNPNMPPTYLYYLVPWADPQQLQAGLEKFPVEEPVQAKTVRPLRTIRSRSSILLEDSISKIRPRYRQEHLEILHAVANLGASTVAEIGQITGSRPQTVHAQAERLRELKLLRRTKRNGQNCYTYMIAPQIDPEAVKVLTTGAGIQSQEEPESLQLSQLQEAQESQKMPTPMEDDKEPSTTASSIQKTSSLAASATPSSSWANLLLSKFPEFDPSWSAEEIEKWCHGFARLMELGAIKEPRH